jgi:hypothetical protein
MGRKDWTKIRKRGLACLAVHVRSTRQQRGYGFPEQAQVNPLTALAITDSPLPLQQRALRPHPPAKLSTMKPFHYLPSSIECSNPPA